MTETLHEDIQSALRTLDDANTVIRTRLSSVGVKVNQRIRFTRRSCMHAGLSWEYTHTAPVNTLRLLMDSPVLFERRNSAKIKHASSIRAASVINVISAQ
jgi:hypothetical protein